MGLRKLIGLWENKNYALKIQAMYKLLNHQTKTPSNIMSINLESANGSDKFINYPTVPLTSRRSRREKKSLAFELKGIQNIDKLEDTLSVQHLKSFLKSEIWKEDLEADLNSEQGFALRSIKCSTKSEFGNFEEEEQIYLFSEWNDSFELEKKDSFSFEIWNELGEDNIQKEERDLSNIELLSEWEEKKENDNEIKKFSSIKSEDTQQEIVLDKKISMNTKDISQMAKQLEEIRKIFES